MWPFKKKPELEKLYYSTTALQVGDDCVCKIDRPHDKTHQKLLSKGTCYKVRSVFLGETENLYGGPFISLEGIYPINDAAWDCLRFDKVIRQKSEEFIVTQVLEPVGLDVEKERELARELWESR